MKSRKLINKKPVTAFLVTVLVLLMILILFILPSKPKVIAKNESVPDGGLHNDSLNLSAADNQSLEHANKSATETKANSVNRISVICEEGENFKDSSMSTGARQWDSELRNGIYDYHIEPYRFADEQTLLLGAESGDAVAMYMLGMRYRWYSHDFTSHFGFGRRPRSSADNKPRPKLDRDIMKKAQYWLYQSALHGELAGLIEYRQALNIERGKRHNTGDITAEESDEMIAQSIANDLLVDWVAPEYADYLDMSHQSHLDIPEMTEHYKKAHALLGELKLRWEANRHALGLPARINVEIPREVKEWRQRYVQCALCEMEHIKRDKRFSSCQDD